MGGRERQKRKNMSKMFEKRRNSVDKCNCNQKLINHICFSPLLCTPPLPFDPCFTFYFFSHATIYSWSRVPFEVVVRLHRCATIYYRAIELFGSGYSHLAIETSYPPPSPPKQQEEQINRNSERWKMKKKKRRKEQHAETECRSPNETRLHRNKRKKRSIQITTSPHKKRHV